MCLFHNTQTPLFAVNSDSIQRIIESELEHLASRLDVIYEQTCKGVHVDVSKNKAQLTVIHTYLFIGEIATYIEKGGK